MSESATKATRRERTSAAITSCAQRLVDQYGLDGFTMEQLAAAAEVSRRTLFNYFTGKLEAVLGEHHPPDPELVATFAAGGPTGELSVDIREAAVAVLDAEHPDDAETWRRHQRVLRNDARIMHASHLRFEEATQHFVDVILEREGGDFGQSRARLVLKVVVAIFDIALEEFLADPSRPLADHFRQTYDSVHDLFGQHP